MLVFLFFCFNFLQVIFVLETLQNSFISRLEAIDKHQKKIQYGKKNASSNATLPTVWSEKLDTKNATSKDISATMK